MGLQVVEFEITPDGTVRMVLDEQNNIREILDGKTISVERASHVEPTVLDGRTFWTVQSAHDPELFVRNNLGNYWVGSKGPVAEFETRKRALEYEQKFFWDLIPKGK